jgi:hypothetical protein
VKLAPSVLAAFLASTATAQVPLESYWPGGAGARWTYDRIQIEWGAAAKTQLTAVRFELGDTTAAGAVQVRPLVVTVQGAATHGSALAARLALARPETRVRLGADAGIGAGSGLVIHDAALVRIADDEIAAYRDAPAMRSWIYLLPDPMAGQTFHIQLIPDLADSVFLDGRVIGHADISTPAGSFTGTARVHYDIDYGWTDVLDPLGQPIGRYRARTHGEMFWAGGVGPVLARETFVPQDSVQGTPPSISIDSTFAELRLQSYALDPTSVARRTWTAVKQLYARWP